MNGSCLHHTQNLLQLAQWPELSSCFSGTRALFHLSGMCLYCGSLNCTVGVHSRAFLHCRDDSATSQISDTKPSKAANKSLSGAGKAAERSEEEDNVPELDPAKRKSAEYEDGK